MLDQIHISVYANSPPEDELTDDQVYSITGQLEDSLQALARQFEATQKDLGRDISVIISA